MSDNFSPAPELKTNRIVLSIVFSAVIFLLFLSALEITLRTTHLFGAKTSWTEPDPLVFYRFTPGSTYWFNKENDHPVSGKINRFGWRDKEWSREKPLNTYRIAVLGDSMVEAMQVESDRTFLALAENQLNAYLKDQNPHAEFMNFGRSGYTQTEEFLILKRDVRPFFPDMVMLFFLPGNDISDVSKETAPSFQRPFFNVSQTGGLTLDTRFTETRKFKLSPYFTFLRRHSALLNLVAERLSAYQAEKQVEAKEASDSGKGEASPRKLNGLLSLCTSRPDPALQRSYQLNKRLIREMAEYCKENKIRFVLVCEAIRPYMPEEDERLKKVDPAFNAHFFEDDLRDFAKTLSIDYVGLQSPFRRAYEKTGMPLHWSHWNYKGHQVVADVLTEKLKPIIQSNEQGAGGL